MPRIPRVQRDLPSSDGAEFRSNHNSSENRLDRALDRALNLVKAALLVALPLGGLSMSCLNEANGGIEPPLDRIKFLSGALLDPRPGVSIQEQKPCQKDSECDAGAACVQQKCQSAAKYLLAVSANSDRNYNGSTVIPFDLSAFFAAAGVLDEDKTPKTTVGDPGQALSREQPCRRSRSRRGLIECDESFFALSDSAAIVGSYAGAPAAQLDSPQEATVVLPVSGDPSLTVLRMEGGLSSDDQDPLRLVCGGESGSSKSDSGQAVRCEKESRLQFTNDDPKAQWLPQNPRSVLTLRQNDQAIAMSLHGNAPQISMVELNRGPAKKSTLVDFVTLMIDEREAPARIGGGAFVQYPCRPDAEGKMAPKATQNCQRALVYASFRKSNLVVMFSVTEYDQQSEACARDQSCGPTIDPIQAFETAGPRVGLRLSDDALGAMSFAPDGNPTQLWILQRTPGVLLKMDTSLDPVTQMPKNSFVDAVDLCSAGTDLKLYSAQDKTYALISCRDDSLLYLVDPNSMQVLRVIDVASTPSQIVIDEVRKVAYVTSFTANAISVVDLDPQRGTRFSEIARLGGTTP